MIWRSPIARHNDQRRRRKFCWLPKRLRNANGPLDDVVWLETVDIFERYVMGSPIGFWSEFLVLRRKTED